MGKVAKGFNKMHFTMLYGNYCYIFMENFSQKFSPCINIINRIFRDMKIHFYTVMKPEFLGSHRDQTSKCILITLAVTVDWWDRSTHSTVLCVRSSLSLYHSSIRCEYKYNDTPHFARISGRGAGGGGIKTRTGGKSFDVEVHRSGSSML